jgi:hypothetical protein
VEPLLSSRWCCDWLGGSWSRRWAAIIGGGVLGRLTSLSTAVTLSGVVLMTRHRFLGPRCVAGVALLLAVSGTGIAVLGLVAALPLAMAGLVVQGGLRSAAAPLTQTWANARAPAQFRATVLSFTGQATALGEIGGGVALSALAAGTTVPTALVCSAGLIVAASVTPATGVGGWAGARLGSPARACWVAAPANPQ